MFKKITLTALAALLCIAAATNVNAQTQSHSWSSKWSKETSSSWSSGPGGIQRSSQEKSHASNSQTSLVRNADGSLSQRRHSSNSIDNHRGISESRGIHGVHQAGFNNTRINSTNGVQTAVRGRNGMAVDTRVNSTTLTNNQGLSRGINSNGTTYLNQHNNTSLRNLQGHDVRAIGGGGGGALHYQNIKRTGFDSNNARQAGFNGTGFYNNVQQSQNAFQNTDGFLRLFQ